MPQTSPESAHERSPEERIAQLEQALAEKEQELAHLRKQNEALEKLAHEDPLTGLLNRRGLERRFDEYVRTHTREQTYKVGEKTPPLYSVIMIDLKGIKQANDTLGHDAGDKLIRDAADAFRPKRPTDIAARTGGDEFAIILPDTDEAGARVVMERIVAELPNNLYCRIGIAASSDLSGLYERDVSLDEVMKTADDLSNDARGKKETRENYAKQNDILTLSDIDAVPGKSKPEEMREPEHI